MAGAEVIGISDRPMRRGRQRYAEHGYEGRFDRRRGKPRTQRVPLKTAEEVLRRYGGQQADFNAQPGLWCEAVFS